MSESIAAPGHSGVDSCYLPLIKLWILKLLLRCDGKDRVARLSKQDAVTLGNFLGVRGSWEGSPKFEIPVLERTLGAAESKRFSPTGSTSLDRWIRSLGSDLG